MADHGSTTSRADALDDWLEERDREEGWQARKAEVQRLVDAIRELRRANAALVSDLHNMGVAREKLRQRLSADKEALRTKLAGHDEGLDRWCNYQDRLVETLDRLGLRETVLAELERDGWRNVPECAHKADAERLRGQTLAAYIGSGQAVRAGSECFAVVAGSEGDLYVKYVYGDYESEGDRPDHAWPLIAVVPGVLEP